MECNDINCPTHGTLAARGQAIEGVVASAKMQKTVIVQKDYYVKVGKYQRYRRARSRIPAHNPPCINAKEGDHVRIMACRKLGKTVSFVIVEKLISKEKTSQKEKAEKKEEKHEEHKEEKKKPVKKRVKLNG